MEGFSMFKRMSRRAKRNLKKFKSAKFNYARFVKDFSVGDKVVVSGRIQSREYQKKIGDEIVTRTAYEVSLNKIDVVKEEIDVDTMETSVGTLENYYVR